MQLSFTHRTLLTVATTVIASKDPAKQKIQQNCLKVLNSFFPFVKTVLFDNNEVSSSWHLNDVTVVRDVKSS